MLLGDVWTTGLAKKDEVRLVFFDFGFMIRDAIA